jgi:dihydroorotase
MKKLTKVDLVLKNGRVLCNGHLIDAGLAVDNGVIVAVAKDPHLPDSDYVFDVKNNLILPGLIDVHVHFRDPGYPDREDFQSGTMAAAAGGFTCIGDMPNPEPSTTTPEAYIEKRKIAEEKALVDFMLYGGTGHNTIKNITPLSNLGARAFKTYTTSKYEALSTTSPSSLLQILKETKANSRILMIHSEDQSIVDHATKHVKHLNLKGFNAHALSRPKNAEELVLKQAVTTTEYTSSMIYICHISSSSGVEAIREAKKRGVKVFAETCPHYLMLTEEDGQELGPYAKTNPPLRSNKDRSALWEGLLDGMETSIPVMMTQVHEGKITLKKLVKVFSENPAKIFGIFPRKGSLNVGSDADITIIGPKIRGKIKGTDFYTKAKTSMFEGFEYKGAPNATFVRGELVMKDGAIINEKKRGEFI